jgi:hypothetical protein
MSVVFNYSGYAVDREGGMKDFLIFLFETNLTTAAFIIGAVALIISIVGGIKAIIEPTPPMRVLLAIFGLFLMVLSVSSYFVSFTGNNSSEQPTSQTDNISPAATQPGNAYRPELCGDSAYEVVFYDDNGIKKTNMTFLFPEGYTESFLTSDPGIVEFSDGQVRTFDTQFTLITSGFSSIKVNGVNAREGPAESGNWVPNSYGCIYIPQDAHRAESLARADYQIYVDANINAVLYRVTPNGFELLASNK